MSDAHALSAIVEWWEESRRELPWRATRDPYAVHVAEVMSAQTQVGRAAAAWTAWMARWPTVDALAAAPLADVLRQWQGLGYPRRARDLHRSARLIAAEGWPMQLESLPGVGPYVAAAIRCFAFEEPVLPRDVNVRRVLARRFPDGIDTSADPWRAGQAVMEFGQRICRARARCAECPVRAGCPAPSAAPEGATARRRPPAARFAGSLRQRRGVVLRQVLAAEGLPLSAVDSEAACSLAADGLLRIEAGVVRPPQARDFAAWNAMSSAARSSSVAKTR